MYHRKRLRCYSLHILYIIFAFSSSMCKICGHPEGYWRSVLGYGNPDLIEPVKSQIDRLINVMSAFRTEEIIPDHDQVEA